MRQSDAKWKKAAADLPDDLRILLVDLKRDYEACDMRADRTRAFLPTSQTETKVAYDTLNSWFSWIDFGKRAKDSWFGDVLPTPIKVARE